MREPEEGDVFEFGPSPWRWTGLGAALGAAVFGTALLLLGQDMVTGVTGIEHRVALWAKVAGALVGIGFLATVVQALFEGR